MNFEMIIREGQGLALVIYLQPRPRSKDKADLKLSVRTVVPPIATATSDALSPPMEPTVSEQVIYLDGGISLGVSRDRNRTIKALAAKKIILTEDELSNTWVAYQEWLAAPKPASLPEFSLCIGAINQPRENFIEITKATAIEAFKEALASPCPTDGVIEWKALDRFAILDVDYHVPELERPSQSFVMTLAESLRPTPICYWISKGGGVHALYANFGAFTAEELAASAGLCARQFDSSGTIEIVPRTRHPFDPGGQKAEIYWREADSALAGLDMLTYRGCSADERDQWLDERGLEVGKRYDHSKCVIDPGHQSHGDPVLIYENGIQCWSCAGRLKTGFTPFGRLIRSDAAETNQLKECAQHFCHFSHALYVLEVLLPWYPEKFFRPLYSAMLKMIHKESDDPRIAMAFREFPYVRGKQAWLHADTLNTATPRLDKDILAHLPTVKYLETNDE